MEKSYIKLSLENKKEDYSSELNTLKWFKEVCLSSIDIHKYNIISPLIVDSINEKENSKELYVGIYDEFTSQLIKSIENDDLLNAYLKYKRENKKLEEEYINPKKLVLTIDSEKEIS